MKSRSAGGVVHFAQEFRSRLRGGRYFHDSINFRIFSLRKQVVRGKLHVNHWLAVMSATTVTMGICAILLVAYVFSAPIVSRRCIALAGAFPRARLVPFTFRWRGLPTIRESLAASTTRCAFGLIASSSVGRRMRAGHSHRYDCHGVRTY